VTSRLCLYIAQRVLEEQEVSHKLQCACALWTVLIRPALTAFIAVDTLLERYRRERRDARASGSPSNGPPRARVRRSGSDLGSSLSLQDLSLTADKNAPVTVPPTDSTEQDESQPKRPSPIRSTSSQESPRHLSAHLGIKELLPEDHTDPILSLVNQMREQRMSSVANAGQYIFTYLALLAGISQELAEEGITAASPVA
jgi:hypothetical protein